MTQRRVCSVMLFAEDPATVAGWYVEALGAASANPIPDGPAWLLDVGDVEVVIHPADRDKNPPGASTVVYWSTACLTDDLARLTANGATLHRGPLEVTSGRTICQLRDLWGSVFGLDGPLHRASENNFS